MTEKPTLGQVMRRPRWIAALVLALIVAAGFAALGQWQLSSAIQNQALNELETELAVPLDRLTTAGDPVGDNAGGRVVGVSGRLVPEDFTIVEQRVNQGQLGYWLVGHLVTSETPAAHVTVALGWAPTREEVEAVAETLAAAEPSTLVFPDLVGRYMPTEEPTVPDVEEDPLALKTMSIPQQANLWQPFTGAIYGGYIVAHTSPEGLELIDSVPPLPQETINWLNLFYALEWIIFAGFALYFWYRVAKDAWVKECERIDDENASRNPGDSELPDVKGQ